MQNSSSSRRPRRPRIVVHTDAELDRLLLRLLLPVRAPAIVIDTDGVPTLQVQRAQHEITRLADGRNWLLGEMLGGATLLGGLFYAWVVNLKWPELAAVVAASLGAGLFGKFVELSGTRIRLLGVLLRLRRQLAAALAAGTAMAARPARVPPAPFGASDLLNRPSLEAEAFREAVPLVAERATGSSPLDQPAPGHVLLRDASDIDQLLPQLGRIRALPVIEVRVDTLPTLDAQRAQHRIVQLSGGCNCVLGAVLAGATLVGGGFYLLWKSTQTWDWYLGDGWSWGPLWLLGVSVLCAGIIGWIAEVTAHRVKLAMLLRGLRSRIEAA